MHESTRMSERRHEDHHKGEGGGEEGDVRTSEDTCGSSGQAWSSWFRIHELGMQAKGGTDDQNAHGCPLARTSQDFSLSGDPASGSSGMAAVSIFTTS